MRFAAGSMMRFIHVVFLTLTIILTPTRGRAAAEKDPRILGLTNTEFAIGVTAAVTGARVAFVLLAGNSLFGPSLGTGLLVIYLGHVVAEGLIFGAGAGASAYAASSASGALDAEQPPSILPQRLAPETPTAPRLPLEMAPPPESPGPDHP